MVRHLIMNSPQVMIKYSLAAELSAPGHASPLADFVIGCILVVVGIGLALDIRGVTSTYVRKNAGFTPWGRRRGEWTGPNPFRLVGCIFLIGGIVFLAAGIARGF